MFMIGKNGLVHCARQVYFRKPGVRNVGESGEGDPGGSTGLPADLARSADHDRIPCERAAAAAVKAQILRDDPCASCVLLRCANVRRDRPNPVLKRQPGNPSRAPDAVLLQLAVTVAHLVPNQFHQLFQGDLMRYVLDIGEPDVIDVIVRVLLFLRDQWPAYKYPAFPIFKSDSDELKCKRFHHTASVTR